MSNNIIAKIETGTDITVKTLSAGPGVSTSIEMKNILDVDNAAEADGRILIYDSASDKHIYIDRFDSASATGLIDSAYVQLRQIKYTTADFTDSSYVASVLPVFGTDFVDSAYVISVLPTLGNDFVDSAYVTNLPISTFTNDADYLDSTTVTGVINSGYIQTNQIKYSTNDFTDSAFVSSSISTAVNNLIDGAPGTLDTLNEIAAALNDDDSAVNSLTALINGKDSDFVKSAANQAWIQSQQITYNTSNFTDSAYVQSVLPTLGGDFVDSAYVTSLPVSTFTNDADYLDSTTVVGVINATYVQNNQIKYTTADFTDSAYVTSVLPTLGGDFVDSAYVTNLPVSTFSNDANYLDSTTVLGVVNQSYVQSNQITYSTNDFTDSAYVQSVLPTLGRDFVDSGYVTSLPVSTFSNDANYLDSTTATGLIDSAYVQLRQTPGTDSAAVLALVTSDGFTKYDSTSTIGLVDSAYIQLRQIKYTTADFTDSAYVTSVLPTLGNDFVDSAYVTSVLPTLGNDFVDSAYVTSVLPTLGNDFVDSAYVTSLPVSTFTNDADYLDSTTVTGVINSSYIQTNQITYNTSNFADSAFVSAQINALIDGAPGTLDTLNEIAAALNDDDSAVNSLTTLINAKDSDFVKSAADQTWIQSQQITYSTADFTDSAYVTSVLPTLGGDFVDSAFVTSLPISTFTNDADYLDSTTVLGVIDQTYVQNNQIKYTTADFTDSAYVTSVLPTLGGDFVDSSYVTGLPVSTFSNDANYLDSTTVAGVIDQTYIQNNQIKYTTADFTDSAYVTSVLPTLGGDFVDSAFVTSLPVSTFTNDADYLDSTTVLGVIDQTYVQNNQIKYTTADFTDSAYVTSVLPTLGGDYVDSAYVTGLPVSTFSNDADYLDSTTVTGVIDQTYVQNNQIKYTTANFTDSAYVTSVLPTLGGDFVDSAQVSAIIIADVIKSFVDALNINAVELGGNDSDYYRLNVYDSAGVLLN